MSPTTGTMRPRLPADAVAVGSAKMRCGYTLLGSDRRYYSSESRGTWGGHRGSKIYGRLDCRAARRAIARGGYVRYRVFFADEATAIAAGYRPCGTCCPERYAVWISSRRGCPRGSTTGLRQHP